MRRRSRFPKGYGAGRPRIQRKVNFQPSKDGRAAGLLLFFGRVNDIRYSIEERAMGSIVQV